jgi:elongation factor G
MNANSGVGPRNVALVGPYLSGKTTLLEAILFATGGIHRKGTAKEANMTGDSSEEARARGTGVELNVASTTFLDDPFTFLDCPGSVEFLQETFNALLGADAAVLVCEADAARAMTIAPLMKQLEAARIPTLLFVNKIDRASAPVGDVIEALQRFSERPLVLREAPVTEDEAVAGYVDLASDRTYAYKPAAASEIVEAGGEVAEATAAARYAMLEKVSDFDDHLMEQLLEDVDPPNDEVFATLTRGFRAGDMVPALFGAGELEHGVRRLLKALRHEVPGPEAAAARAGVTAEGEALAQVLKTYVTPHGGKLSLARVWRGPVTDGTTLNGERVSGLHRMRGQHTDKIDAAVAGEVVAMGRLDTVKTGDTLAPGKGGAALARAEVLPSVLTLAITAANREDEVKLSDAMGKLLDEDPSVAFEQAADTHQMLLHGQGEIHLRVACDRLKNKYGLEVATVRPKVPYKEAIKKSISQHGRFKRQTGGHGQFGDVHLDIKPLARGEGFVFADSISGGAVPKQYIPAAGAGVSEYLRKGPLGFPVVDISVTLTDGQFHAVDSSELAFKTAARIAMTEGMRKCDPVLLEPILRVDISVPSEFTSKANTLVSSRRGQILGFEGRPGWSGWDVVAALVPASECHDLIVEIRSLTLGVGTYTASLDHLQELHGRLADDVVSAHTKE